MSVIFPPVVISGFRAKAVTFDGSNDYVSRAGVSGASAGSAATLSFWVKWANDDTFQSILFLAQSGDITFYVRRDEFNYIDVYGENSGGTVLIRIRCAADTSKVSHGWQHVLVSFQLNSDAKIYINDTNATFLVPVNSSGSVDFSTNEAVVGASQPASFLNKLNGDLAEVWFNTSYLDLTVAANRRKFIKSNGKPANLGSDGSLPTGSQPLLYFRGPATSFSTNRGTGGAFTLTGALTDAATSPSD